MLKWHLKVTNEDMKRITVTRMVITNRRWMMPHNMFLSLISPDQRAFWRDVFAQRFGELPLTSYLSEKTQTIEWKSDKEMGAGADALWRDADKRKDSECEVEPTGVCLIREADSTNGYRFNQMLEESGLPQSDKDLVKDLEKVYDDSEEQFDAKQEPVRMYMASEIREAGCLNLGLPKSVWPITQLGQLYVTTGRLRDFVRVRKEVHSRNEETTSVLKAVVAPCPCEWVEDIQSLCIRQGGIAEEKDPKIPDYKNHLIRLMSASSAVDLPFPTMKNCRTLIL